VFVFGEAKKKEHTLFSFDLIQSFFSFVLTQKKQPACRQAGKSRTKRYTARFVQQLY